MIGGCGIFDENHSIPQPQILARLILSSTA